MRIRASQATLYGMSERLVLDGNEAAALVAHSTSEVIAIYPITPASRDGRAGGRVVGEGEDEPLGDVPVVIEMQSEGGAAGAVHGALQAGALTTTFTASQGLLLMIPNMFKIAGELTPFVIHVAARAVATHALSIFGDHSDVMAAARHRLRAAGLLGRAGGARLRRRSRTPRRSAPAFRSSTSSTASAPRTRSTRSSRSPTTSCARMIDDELVDAHRARALSPDHPVIRGTAQNPDVFFQAREAANPYYAAVPGIVAAERWTASPS